MTFDSPGEGSTLPPGEDPTSPPGERERVMRGGRETGDPAGGALAVHAFTGGAFGENTYVLHCPETRRAAIVDPGAAAPEAIRFVREEGLELEAVYLTHAHVDHVEGLPEVASAFSVPVHLHPADRPLYDRSEEQARAFGMPLGGPLPEPDLELRPGERVGVGRHRLEVRFAPGHAPGHVILRADEAGFVLVGDVVFAGSIGRTDLPGGDMQELLDSIRREILSLPDETRLLPGHGPETTVGRERRGNPFLAPQEPGARA